MITTDNKFFKQQWGLRLINAPEAWQLLNGGSQALNGNANEIAFGSPNIKIAVIDTGVETINNIPVSSGFKGLLTNGDSKFLKHVVSETSNGSFDFIDFISGPHGESVTGIASSKSQINGISSYDGSGVVGIAPNCSLYTLATGSGNASIIFKLLYAHALAGLEYTLATFSVYSAINSAYNFTVDGINFARLYKKIGTLNATERLNFFLNNSYVDIFNFSLQILQNASLASEHYSIAVFNEITSLGRNGRGCVIVVGAGNDGLDIEPTPNQFLNEMAASNKPLIVGAVSIDNGYNWLTGTPSPNTKRSSYSNFGTRIDICAPGGGGTVVGQEDNTIFTNTVNGAGELHSNSPLKLSLKTKINAVEFVPPNPDYYEYVVLEFDNVNGVYEGQKIVLGDFNNINSFEFYYVNGIVLSMNRIAISRMKKTTYASLIDSTMTGVRTVFEFVPLFTKITTAGTTSVIKVESVKGAYPYTTEEIFIGSLGDLSTGHVRKISTINSTTNEITLTRSVNSNVGDYVVFPRKTANVVATTATGNIVKEIKVDSIIGFFVGCSLLVQDSTDFYNVSVSAIDYSTKMLKLALPLTHLNNTTNPFTKIYLYGLGDITTDFNGTSAATPFVSGLAALILSANQNLSSSEVKHIIKESASSAATTSGAGIPGYVLNSDGYQHSSHYGTGLIDAHAAIQMALNWHVLPSIQKPVMKFFDNDSGTIVPVNQIVDSPDIWVKELIDTSVTLPTPSQPFNTLDTTTDQKIYVRVRNIGNRQSFKECDLKLFVSFTDDVNPNFPFPDKWFHNIDVANEDPIINSTLHNNSILIGIKEIPIIPANSEVIISFEWKNISDSWSSFWNVLNKKAYILAHIAPFDGTQTDISLTNIRNNKNLTCKPINVTHFNSFILGADGTKTKLPEDVYNLTANPIEVSKSFIFEISNILESRLNALKFTFIKKNRASGAIEQTVIYKKTGTSWGFDVAPTADWVKIEPVISITDSILSSPNYKNVSLNFILTIDETVLEVTYDVSI
ncbi:hypothetical protein SY27_05180 [Flavobacterium sp. 316]|uniref:S8 family serine peptidase n=1 Tax=Flavobacterium sp. 316 TaxID=1603293 RepID=UPI0005E188CF|nr:S8 family serine peptidase [Flavobacterium sp. 316]KIX22063.1 hypothetical protein SY27_05180 [Flavobacterium sp. 316]